MILVKIKNCDAGHYEYINLERIEFVNITDGRYNVAMSDRSIVRVALDDPVILGLVSAANAAYTGT
jgi:hypothetical protein